MLSYQSGYCNLVVLPSPSERGDADRQRGEVALLKPFKFWQNLFLHLSDDTKNNILELVTANERDFLESVYDEN